MNSEIGTVADQNNETWNCPIFDGVNIILLQHIQFDIVHLYRQFTLDWKWIATGFGNKLKNLY